MKNGKIFGVPLSNINKPNLISVIDFEKKKLEYYPLNVEETTDENDRLACTFLKYYLDPLTEYKDTYLSLR